MTRKFRPAANRFRESIKDLEVSRAQRWTLDKRTISEESLQFASAIIRQQNLADLRRINGLTLARWKLVRTLGKYVARREPFSFLDIGGASGDMGDSVRRNFPLASTYLLDLEAENMAGARHPKAVADAFRLPLRDGACEVVHCSLFLHHFEESECVVLLREMVRVASRLVIVQDLHRHFIAWNFLRMTQPLLGWHPLTVSDGQLSVAAGWKRDELSQLICKAIPEYRANTEWHFPSFRYFIAIETNKAN